MSKSCILLSLFLVFALNLCGQNVVKGYIFDEATNDAIIGGNVIIEGTTEGTITDWDGSFELSTTQSLPLNLEISYIGYETKIITVAETGRLDIFMAETSNVLTEIVVKGSRISEKQKESPLTIEALDIIAIKETPAADFYDGLGTLKGVDLTAASLGFKVINTRGFNSTSPVRSLQIIDGIDNQAPGLNFSLGNFLGTSELDINKVEIIVGASSAFYGPNAFNGVISMETKSPYFYEGLSASLKGGERNYLKGAIRWADAFENENGDKTFAYKLNLELLRADDWEADNDDPVFDTDFDRSNPGGYDRVNWYGDEFSNAFDFSESGLNFQPGLIYFARPGYKEADLVDYDTRNYKAGANFHYRLKPDMAEQSPELIFANSFGSGTTVYQGDNRFSLKGITFLQNRLELRKRGTYFLRAYTTRTSAGDSYDPFFTALQLLDRTKNDVEWSGDYQRYWVDNIEPQIREAGFPELQIRFDENGQIIPDTEFPINAQQWLDDNESLLRDWHAEAAAFANGPGQGSSTSLPYFVPGTAEFDAEFEDITSSFRNEGGTRFFDNSALYHVHGEYKFKPSWADEITVGANYRLYAPESRGTVFFDSLDIKIRNSEVGAYTGIQKSFFDNKLKAQFAVRADKNQNFNLLVSPAGSLVYTPSENNFFRISYSSAIRNPTLADQYLQLNVGRAILSGNLDGAQDLVTVESLFNFFDTNDLSELDSFDIAPIRPEKVKTLELGYRTTLFDKLFLDAGYYYSVYDDFIGFNIGVDFDFTVNQGIVAIQDIQPFRYSANSINRVSTQGVAVGANYYLSDNYSINGNYSWNRLSLNEEILDDPIIPAFNTPEHKFNIGFGGRKLQIGGLKNFSFNLNYKWVQGFLFEGSPQFTGLVPTYDMLDGQVSFGLSKINSVIKIGATNILDNAQFQTYGGPRIGRLAYVSWTYDSLSK